MPAFYPAEIADLRNLSDRNGVDYDGDKTTCFFSKDHNDLIAEVAAIETELGINPAGVCDTVVERLAAIEAALIARVSTIESSATPTPPGDICSTFTITALEEAAELQTPSGTPRNGQKLIVRIKDDGTPRALTYSVGYRAIGVTLPTTTSAGKEVYLGAIYNSASTKWEIVALAQES